MNRWMCLSVLVVAACGGKAQHVDKAQPTTTVVASDKQASAEPADVPVTAKSPQAVEAFQKGRKANNGGNSAEAVAQFKAAIAIDPDFAQAYAYLGMVTPGAEGNEALAKAVSLAKTLPEAEQQLIIAMHADRSGDLVKARAAFERALELVPTSMRVAFALGNTTFALRDYNAGLKYYQLVLQLDPANAVAYNGLAACYAGLHQWPEAEAAAKKQVELRPTDANAQDTLGEILLQQGKLDDAEKAFVASSTTDPKFQFAWQGITFTRAYRGDFKGAHDASEKRKANATGEDKLQAMLDDAWVSLAENKLPQALATLDAVEKDPAAKGTLLFANTAILRGHVLQLSGKLAEATKAYETGKERAQSLDEASKNDLLRGYRLGVVRLAGAKGKPVSDADAWVQAAEAELSRGLSPSHVAYLKGSAAWAKHDDKAAIAELSKCAPEYSMCRLDLAAAQRRAGDKAGAEATEKQILQSPTRDGLTVYVFSRLSKH